MESLQREIAGLRNELDDARQAFRALATGEIDALTLDAATGPVLLLAAQEKLRQSEHLLRAVFDRARDAMFLTNVEGLIIDANPAACTLFGLALPALRGRTVGEFADAPASWVPSSQAARVQSRELCVRRADGTTVDTEYTSSANILPEIHLWVMRDVSVRKRAEQARAEGEVALRDSRSLLEQAQAIAHVGSWVWQLQERGSLRCSNECYRMFGLDAEAAVSIELLLERVHPADQQRVRLAALSFGEGNTSCELEHRIVKTDGTVRWVRTGAVLELDTHGAPKRLLGTVQDTTDHKRAEEVQLRLASIVESSSDAILSKDLAGVITTCNPGAERLLGYPASELIGKSIATLLPAGGIAHESAMLQLLSAGGTIEHFETVFVKKDGAVVEVSMTLSPLRGADGRVIGASSISRDLTERRRSEDMLRKTEEQLRQSQKMDAVGRLAAGVAHDFNNILSVLLTYSSFALEALDESDPVWKDIREMQKATERGAKLTRDLLAFSRQQVVQHCVLSVGQIVRGMEPMLRRLLREDVELSLFVSDLAGNIMGDSGQIEQILLNLVVNAVDAMPRGGTLTIEVTPVTLDGDYAATHLSVTAGRYVLLKVTDTGTGMSAPTRMRMFEPFFTTKEQGKGTGLGLSTVFGIVEQFGGHIEVDSQPDEGTGFRIYFERSDERVSARPSPVPAQSLGGVETVLVVDDEAQVRIATCSVLRRKGYTVLEAESGSQALALSAEYEGPIHLLLTDVVMPRMSGRELAQELMLTRPETRVLYASGHTNDSILLKGVLDSDVHFIQKPIAPPQLAKRVRDVLDAERRVPLPPRTSPHARSG